MRFTKYCPTHGSPSGIIIDKTKTILEPMLEGDTWVVRCKYAICGCVLEKRIPFKDRIKENKYILIRNSGDTKQEHRIVWESHYGTLSDDVVVHHINGIKSDNRIENLIAITKSSHKLLHNQAL